MPLVSLSPSPVTVPGRRPIRASRTSRAVLVGLLLTLVAGMAIAARPVPAAAAEAPTMEAAVMLDGHGRVGSWMAIEVRLRNDGPAMTGELRLTGGMQRKTTFGAAVDLPPQSNQVHLLYAQPPAFGGVLDVELVAGGRTVATTPVAFTVHDQSQLVVGVVAEQPESIVPQLDLVPSPNGGRPAVIPLRPADLPERVEAWATLDRLIWQDAESGQLSPAQGEALRGWIAGGGRLVIAGGTAGAGVLSGFPDDLLPYRPAATVDVAPASLSSLLGDVPVAATDVPALAGDLARGRALVTVGDRVVAADMSFGSGSVTILGFDPGHGWIADLDAVESLWRRLLPPRTGGPVIGGDDSPLVNAVSQLPALALPPIGGLLVLLGGYILLIGPINYLVLRRLDRREWAWVTMPVLILVFAAGAYGFGAALRGLDVIVNEVAIVRGAAGTTQGTAQVYLGLFSPSRGTYQVEVPGGALLSAPMAGDFLGGASAALDVLQGDPARIRDLAVGFGSLRTVRAETASPVPLIEADLRLEDGTLRGTVSNRSDQRLERAAVVVGTSVVVLGDLAPGGTQQIQLPIREAPFGQSLSDRILGNAFFGSPVGATDSAQRGLVRRAVIDQLTYDPTFSAPGQLQAESPVLLAWGTGRVLDVRVSGQQPRRTGNVLYYIPLPMRVEGAAVFAGDLIRSSLIETDAAFFNKEQGQLNMARGTATLAYRPIAFEGSIRPTRLVLGLNFGEVSTGRGADPLVPADPQPCREEETDEADCAAEPEPPAPCEPSVEACPEVPFQGLPALELFDRAGGGWTRMTPLKLGNVYDVREPERYVDPGSGTVLVRFVSENDDGVGFNFGVRVEGVVE